MDSTRRIKAAAATLTVGFLLAVAVAAAAQAGNAIPSGMTVREWKAMQARGEPLNRMFHLGAYSPGVAAGSVSQATKALQIRSNALDQRYHLGRYAVTRVSSRFDWTDAGIGAGTMLGALLGIGGLMLAVRQVARRGRAAQATA